MPTVLVSSDKYDFERAFACAPDFMEQPTILGRSIYNWVIGLITMLEMYLGNSLTALTGLVSSIEERLETLKELAQANPTHMDPKATSSHTAASAITPKKTGRCQRCHATGHDKEECRTKDPTASKKRVANNIKARKDQQQRYSRALPVSNPSFPWGHHLNYLQDPIIPPRQSSSLGALAADTKELMRRKQQLTRNKSDKHSTRNHNRSTNHSIRSGRHFNREEYH